MAEARTRPRHSSQPAGPNYVAALATANRFLHAWQSNDLESGMVLLSDGVRRAHNADQLENFFSVGSDRAFEIARGSGHRGRYSFPVVLLTQQGAKLHRKDSTVILVNTGKNDWAIDKLP
jgi:hypothetical protein